MVGQYAPDSILLGSCKLHDVNLCEWLKDVITKLPTHPKNQMNELLPLSGGGKSRSSWQVKKDTFAWMNTDNQ